MNRYSLFVACTILISPIPALADGTITVSESNNGSHVIAGTNTNNGANSDGIRGKATGTGKNAGVVGSTTSAADGAAGVRGSDGSGAVTLAGEPIAAGVSGDSKSNWGVLGQTTEGAGVHGIVYDAQGRPKASGSLGRKFRDKLYGVLATGDIHTTRGDITTVKGDIKSLDGKKEFVEHHPSDPSLAIVYVRLLSA